MVKPAFEALSSAIQYASAFFPPGLVISLAAANIEGGKYWKVYKAEFVGTMLMIVCTFSAGKWWGADSLPIAWTMHALGVICADYFGGGPHVNPAMTVSMLTLGKCDYTEAFVRIAGAMGGGLVSFPLFYAIADMMSLTPFGGPQFSAKSGEDHPVEAALSEFVATFLLCWAIYLLNWEFNFGKYHYIIKQTGTAVAIRALIEFFPVAGPAMNPMLATAWDVFGVGRSGEFPTDHGHYFVYWVCPCLAAVLASISYVIVSGGTVFGYKMPIQLKGKTVKKD